MQENKLKYYSGVGSRKIPQDIKEFMVNFARFMRNRNYILRSGHADGADYAFELGSYGKSEIYLPWKGFNSELDLIGTATNNYIVLEITDRHIELVDEIHGLGFEKLKNARKGGDKFHARNMNQVLGKDVSNPVLSDFLVCWTPDGAEKSRHCNINTGGTATAIKIADKFNVPIFNLFNKDAKDRLKDFCRNELEIL